MDKKRTLIASALLAVTLFTATGFGQGMPPTLVVTDQVLQMDFHDQITLVGRTAAAISSRIVAEVSGRVAKINTGEGIAVERDQPLITIDSERAGLLLAAKEAQTRAAAALVVLRHKDSILVQDLFRRDLASERTLDSVQLATTIARAGLLERQAERDLLKLDYDNCTIKAPFAGYTARKLVDVGEWVNMGSPVYEMVDLSKVRVTVDLPERHFGHLALGSPAVIFRTGDDQPITGVVTGIAPDASETTHTFPVIITIDNKDGRLGGGMLVRATVNLNEQFSSLAVSKDALIRQGSQTMIYTVVEGKAAPLPVVVSSTNGKMIAIEGEGIVEGMPVVVRGNERIFPGAPVRVQGETPAEGTEAGNSEASGG